MRPVVVTLAGAAVAGLMAVAALAQQQGGEKTANGAASSTERAAGEVIAIGREIYAENCASCHGASLEGQPDWRRRLENGRMPAPPHDETGHTWHHSDQDLFAITKRGVEAIVPGYASDMPGFAGVLSDAEISAVLAYIKSTWPARQREFQAQITASDEGGS